MSLDRAKLQKVRGLANGGLQAQCPACAEAGADRAGEHLRIYPDGKFGCCVHPGNSSHRRRIFALAGERSRTEIKVRVAAATNSRPLQVGILQQLASKFEPTSRPDAPDGVEQLESDKCGAETGEDCRTGRTGETNLYSNMVPAKSDLRTGRTGETESTGELFKLDRTLRTPLKPLCTTQEIKNDKYNIKGFDYPVRSVRGEKGRLPYLTPAGDLRIPFDSPERYHWWKPPFENRLRVKEIIAELQERKELDASPF